MEELEPRAEPQPCDESLPDVPRVTLWSMPRRFDLLTMFVVTFAYAVMFGLMRALQIPTILFLYIAGSFTVVGLAQALLFKGKHPRIASILAGGVFFTIVTLILLGIDDSYFVPRAILGLLCLSIQGAILGYLAGVMIGSVLMLTDVLRRLLSRSR